MHCPLLPWFCREGTCIQPLLSSLGFIQRGLTTWGMPCFPHERNEAKCAMQDPRPSLPALGLCLCLSLFPLSSLFLTISHFKPISVGLFSSPFTLGKISPHCWLQPAWPWGEGGHFTTTCKREAALEPDFVIRTGRDWTGTVAHSSVFWVWHHRPEVWEATAVSHGYARASCLSLCFLFYSLRLGTQQQLEFSGGDMESGKYFLSTPCRWNAQYRLPSDPRQHLYILNLKMKETLEDWRCCSMVKQLCMHKTLGSICRTKRKEATKLVLISIKSRRGPKIIYI